MKQSKPIRLILHEDGMPNENPELVHAVFQADSSMSILCSFEVYKDGDVSIWDNQKHYVEMPEGTKITCPRCVSKFTALLEFTYFGD